MENTDPLKNSNLTEQDEIEIQKIIKETNAEYDMVVYAYLYRNKDSDMAYLMVLSTFEAGNGY